LSIALRIDAVESNVFYFKNSPSILIRVILVSSFIRNTGAVNSSVGKLTTLWVGKPPDRGSEISNIQTCSVAHPHSFSTRIGGLIHWE